MTMEEYGKAQSIAERIHRCQRNIDEIRYILNNNPNVWRMNLYPPSLASGIDSCHKIDHFGLLPELLEAVLEKHEKELKRLKKQLAEI